jgi:hypothetical protein
MYTLDESCVLVSAQSTKLEEKVKVLDSWETYSRAESEELVNSQGFIEKDQIKDLESYQNSVYSFCEKETNDLVQAESSKMAQEETKETPSYSDKKVTWRFEEVFALIENCYDPRNFGKVPLRRASA